jgi:hypothetical protein
VTPVEARVLRKIENAWPGTVTKNACKPISPRAFEAAVHELRLAGHPIASDAEGYWIAQTPAELEDTANALEDRLRTQYATIKALRATVERMHLRGEGAEALTLGLSA